MTELLGIPIWIWIPGMLALYALSFIAGGIYYLEQRVARIRDQFPNRRALAILTGSSALCIGILATISIGGYMIRPGPDMRMGTLVGTVAGVGFWVCRMHIDLTHTSRIRDGILALICATLAVLTGWWIKTF